MRHASPVEVGPDSQGAAAEDEDDRGKDQHDDDRRSRKASFESGRPHHAGL